jgi:hypothetical protein
MCGLIAGQQGAPAPDSFRSPGICSCNSKHPQLSVTSSDHAKRDFGELEAYFTAGVDEPTHPKTANEWGTPGLSWESPRRTVKSGGVDSSP